MVALKLFKLFSNFETWKANDAFLVATLASNDWDSIQKGFDIFFIVLALHSLSVAEKLFLASVSGKSIPHSDKIILIVYASLNFIKVYNIWAMNLRDYLNSDGRVNYDFFLRVRILSQLR